MLPTPPNILAIDVPVYYNSLLYWLKCISFHLQQKKKI